MVSDFKYHTWCEVDEANLLASLTLHLFEARNHEYNCPNLVDEEYMLI